MAYEPRHGDLVQWMQNGNSTGLWFVFLNTNNEYYLSCIAGSDGNFYAKSLLYKFRADAPGGNHWVLVCNLYDMYKEVFNGNT